MNDRPDFSNHSEATYPDTVYHTEDALPTRSPTSYHEDDDPDLVPPEFVRRTPSANAAGAAAIAATTTPNQPELPNAAPTTNKEPQTETATSYTVHTSPDTPRGLDPTRLSVRSENGYVTRDLERDSATGQLVSPDGYVEVTGAAPNDRETTDLICEAAAELVNHGVTQWTDHFSHPGAVIATGRAMGSENMHYYDYDPDGSEVPLPLTDAQAADSVERANERLHEAEHREGTADSYASAVHARVELTDPSVREHLGLMATNTSDEQGVSPSSDAANGTDNDSEAMLHESSYVAETEPPEISATTGGSSGNIPPADTPPTTFADPSDGAGERVPEQPHGANATSSDEPPFISSFKAGVADSMELRVQSEHGTITRAVERNQAGELVSPGGFVEVPATQGQGHGRALIREAAIQLANRVVTEWNADFTNPAAVIATEYALGPMEYFDYDPNTGDEVVLPMTGAQASASVELAQMRLQEPKRYGELLPLDAGIIHGRTNLTDPAVREKLGLPRENPS